MCVADERRWRRLCAFACPLARGGGGTRRRQQWRSAGRRVPRRATLGLTTTTRTTVAAFCVRVWVADARACQSPGERRRRRPPARCTKTSQLLVSGRRCKLRSRMFFFLRVFAREMAARVQTCFIKIASITSIRRKTFDETCSRVGAARPRAYARRSVGAACSSKLLRRSYWRATRRC